MDVKGDLDVCRTITARRADLGLQDTSALAADLDIERHSAFHQRIATDNLGTKDVNMPDATTLPEGWSLMVSNYSASDSLSVKANDGVTEIDAIVNGATCIFYLVDNSSSNGTWVKFCNQPVPRYCDDFVIADFAAASGGYHTYTLTEATHGLGVNPMVQVMELSGSDHLITIPDQVKINSSGDIEIRVSADDSESPSIDCRFDGRICVV